MNGSVPGVVTWLLDQLAERDARIAELQSTNPNALSAVVGDVPGSDPDKYGENRDALLRGVKA